MKIPQHHAALGPPLSDAKYIQPGAESKSNFLNTIIQITIIAVFFMLSIE
jgi:hypothetical protein